MHAQVQRWEAPSNDQIRERTRAATNDKIDRETQVALDQVGDSPAKIFERLDALDREWDLDRAIMLNFAIAGGLSAALAMRGLYKHGRFNGWGALFGAQLAFLAHHAIRRWCPPMPVFRAFGFRSAKEIEAERSILQKRLEARRI